MLPAFSARATTNKGAPTPHREVRAPLLNPDSAAEPDCSACRLCCRSLVLSGCLRRREIACGSYRLKSSLRAKFTGCGFYGVRPIVAAALSLIFRQILRAQGRSWAVSGGASAELAGRMNRSRLEMPRQLRPPGASGRCLRLEIASPACETVRIELKKLLPRTMTS